MHRILAWICQWSNTDGVGDDPYVTISMGEAGDASDSAQAVAIMTFRSIGGSGRNVRGCIDGGPDNDEFNDEPTSDIDRPGRLCYQGGWL